MASCRSKVRVAVRALVKTRERTRRRIRRRTFKAKNQLLCKHLTGPRVRHCEADCLCATAQLSTIGLSPTYQAHRQ
jgi:hypothetical protein